MSYESVQTRIFLQKYLINMLLSSRNVYVKIKVSDAYNLSIYLSIYLSVYLFIYLFIYLSVTLSLFQVLKLFVSLLQEGHPDFHKNLQKYPESFKDAASKPQGRRDRLSYYLYSIKL